ncbi:MAG: DUF3795 domain-containing protein [Candidatus Bathyarchaeota archaeon]|nr:DUF3795 domain-containing protein [Candidatus Bathyarchaeota archaeon]
MSSLVSKCGIDCGSCPWGPYPREGMSAEEFEVYKNRAKTILGYMPIRTACPTCQTPDEQIPKGSMLPNRRCLIRQCIDKTGIANCAYCTRFPCDTLKATAGAWNRKTVEQRLGATLEEEDYRVFVKPFEGIQRLEAIRATLQPQDIVEPAKAPTPKVKVTDFPEELPYSSEEVEAFRALHDLLAGLARSSLGLRDTDTFAQQNKLENLRAHVFRFLWILGHYGTFDENTNMLIVDAQTYIENRGKEKNLAMWSFVNETIFKILSELGVHCERAASKGTKQADLTTGMGYMRNKGWTLQITFSKELGEAHTLKALQTYTQQLTKQYNKKAFQQFQTANMQPLLKN